jgi:hypothetical protein
VSAVHVTLVFEPYLWSYGFVSKLRFLVLPCQSSFLRFGLGPLIPCVGAVDFALSPNYFLFPVFSVSSGAPGKASTWRRKCPASKLTESSNSMRQDSGSPPRLNFVELVLLPPSRLFGFSAPMLWCCFLFALSGLFYSGARSRAVFLIGLQSSLWPLLLSVLAPSGVGLALDSHTISCPLLLPC